MNKKEADYIAARIREEINGKMIRCSCKAPDLVSHIRKAAVDGSLVLKSGADIKEVAKRITIETSDGGYCDSSTIRFVELFKKPQSYIAAQTAHVTEEKMIEEENEKRGAFAQSLIDKVYLGKFDEDPEEPIRQIVAYKP